MKDTLVPLYGVIILCLIAFGDPARADFGFGEAVNMGPRLNSPAVEGTPVMPADGLSIFFDSSRSGGSGDYDVWTGTRETLDGEWTIPVSLGSPVNSAEWDGVPSISSDGLTLFLGSYRSGGYGGSDIWVTRRETKDGPWAAPVNIGPAVNSASDEWTQSISADGLELYFASWRPGGAGGADLWIATRATAEEDWNAPVNLGSIVNSSADDVNPSISADGLHLFFFSVRPGGYGSRDVWLTRRASREDDWQAPVNLGPPVNTINMDQGACLAPDGYNLLFCSNRSGGYGSLDLMQVPLIPIVDFNGDGKVDGGDVLRMAEHWDQDYPPCDMGPTPLGDGIVDIQDLRVLAEHIGTEVTDPTLLAHWALDETAGGTAADGAGNHNGTIVGIPLWHPTDGQVDGALELNGTVFIVADFVLDPAAGPFSVLAWVKGGLPGQAIVSQQNGAEWLLLDGATGALMTELGEGGRLGQPLVSDVTITDDAWHRVGFTWDGSNRMLYVDEVLVAQDTQETLAGSPGKMILGADANMAPGTFWTGLIDDIRIYNRAVKP